MPPARCYAQNMAYGIKPPPLGEWIVNLGEAAEYMFDHNIFQDNLVGVDFCEIDGEGNQSRRVGKRRKKTEAPHAKDHGYRTIADIMHALNPFEGEFYRETLQVSRYTREMFCLMEGRHVHPSTLYPGGVGTVPSIQLFTDYLVRLMQYIEFMKRCVPLHDDLFDFFYEALPGYEKVGQRRILLGCWGSFQDPDVCDYNYKTMDKWGKAMFVTPGHRRRRQAGHDQPGRYQPRHPHPAGLVLLRRLGGEREDDFVKHDPLGNPVDQAASVESDDHSQAAEARFQRQLHLGHVAALVRQAHRRSSGARYRRRADRAALGHGARRTGRYRLCQSDRQQREDSICRKRR